MRRRTLEWQKSGPAHLNGPQPAEYEKHHDVERQESGPAEDRRPAAVSVRPEGARHAVAKCDVRVVGTWRQRYRYRSGLGRPLTGWARAQLYSSAAQEEMFCGPVKVPLMTLDYSL